MSKRRLKGSKIFQNEVILPNGSKRRSKRFYHISRTWVKKEVNWVKNLTKKEVLPKMGHKGGQKGSKIYGSC